MLGGLGARASRLETAPELSVSRYYEAFESARQNLLQGPREPQSCRALLATPPALRSETCSGPDSVQTLPGLALASRFNRAVAPSPAMPEPVDPARIDAFVAGPLRRYRQVTEGVRALASYDAAILMAHSSRVPTLRAVYRRLQDVRDTVSDEVTRNCAQAFQYSISDSSTFESSAASCRSWPWLVE